MQHKQFSQLFLWHQVEWASSRADCSGEPVISSSTSTHNHLYQADLWCRKPASFVGLKNAGATCYLNSVFQQLFMQPSIRRLVLSSPELPAPQRQDSVFYQLQVHLPSLISHQSDPRNGDGKSDDTMAKGVPCLTLAAVLLLYWKGHS